MITGEGRLYEPVEDEPNDWLASTKTLLNDQVREITNVSAESVRIMQVSMLRANAEILEGLLKVTKNQVDRLERKNKTPETEKIRLS